MALAIEIDDYAKEARRRLGEEIKGHKKVYLDANFWINLRNAALGQPRQNIWQSLLHKLLQLAESEVIVCPISDVLLLELLVSNRGSLNTQIQLIDSLSKGVSIIARFDRVQFELLYFIRKTAEGAGVFNVPADFVWTKLVYALGYMMPRIRNASEHDNIKLQKAWLDHSWNYSLLEMMSRVGEDFFDKMPTLKPISPQLNLDKITYEKENRTSSLNQLFLSELRGFLEAHKSEFESVWEYMYKTITGKSLKDGELEEPNPGKFTINFIHKIFQLNNAETYFPTFNITAALYAQVRNDLNRKFKENDFMDFMHAEAALPYCDFFFTEKPLKHLVTCAPFRLAAKYNCIVEASPEAALAQLEKL